MEIITAIILALQSLFGMNAAPSDSSLRNKAEQIYQSGNYQVDQNGDVQLQDVVIFDDAEIS